MDQTATIIKKLDQILKKIEQKQPDNFLGRAKIMELLDISDDMFQKLVDNQALNGIPLYKVEGRWKGLRSEIVAWAKGEHAEVSLIAEYYKNKNKN